MSLGITTMVSLAMPYLFHRETDVSRGKKEDDDKKTPDVETTPLRRRSSDASLPKRYRMVTFPRPHNTVVNADSTSRVAALEFGISTPVRDRNAGRSPANSAASALTVTRIKSSITSAATAFSAGKGARPTPQQAVKDATTGARSDDELAALSTAAPAADRRQEEVKTPRTPVPSAGEDASPTSQGRGTTSPAALSFVSSLQESVEDTTTGAQPDGTPAASFTPVMECIEEQVETPTATDSSIPDVQANKEPFISERVTYILVATLAAVVGLACIAVAIGIGGFGLFGLPIITAISTAIALGMCSCMCFALCAGASYGAHVELQKHE